MIAAVVQMTSTDDVEANLARADALIERAADCGARLIALPENFPFMREEGAGWEILSDPGSHEAVLEALKGTGAEPATAEITRIPQNSVKVEGKHAAAVLRLVEAIEEQDDVQNVYSNFDIDDAELEALAK